MQTRAEQKPVQPRAEEARRTPVRRERESVDSTAWRVPLVQGPKLAVQGASQPQVPQTSEVQTQERRVEAEPLAMSPSDRKSGRDR